jgi:glucose-1-phosphate adenylyltransferase
MILAGGEGKRLFPLTAERAKPAVPFAGKYRIIDFALSSFINSGIYAVYVLTQFKAQSLVEHLQEGWQFGGILSDHFVIPVPAQMRRGRVWYRGTADAVYQNLHLIRRAGPEYVAVFGADHVYRMHVGQMLDFHEAKRADVTVAARPVPLAEAKAFGVLTVDQDCRIIGFAEKVRNPPPIPGQPDLAFASMGNYLFRPDLLMEALEADASQDTAHDFGRDIIPSLIRRRRVYAYDFRHNRIPGVLPGGDPTYWRDVGSIEAYFDAHMELLGERPPLNLRNRHWPIRTATYSDPPAAILRMDGSGVENSLLAEGCAVLGGVVRNAVLGRNVVVHRGAIVEDAVVNDWAEIGEGARVRRAILDKGAVASPAARIGYDGEAGGRSYHVSETGITVVPRAPLHPPPKAATALAGLSGQGELFCFAQHGGDHPGWVGGPVLDSREDACMPTRGSSDSLHVGLG